MCLGEQVLASTLCTQFVIPLIAGYWGFQVVKPASALIFGLWTVSLPAHSAKTRRRWLANTVGFWGLNTRTVQHERGTSSALNHVYGRVLLKPWGRKSAFV
jgi:hypothetical protein